MRSLHTRTAADCTIIMGEAQVLYMSTLLDHVNFYYLHFAVRSVNVISSFNNRIL